MNNNSGGPSLSARYTPLVVNPPPVSIHVNTNPGSGAAAAGGVAKNTNNPTYSTINKARPVVANGGDTPDVPNMSSIGTHV